MKSEGEIGFLNADARSEPILMRAGGGVEAGRSLRKYREFYLFPDLCIFCTSYSR